MDAINHNVIATAAAQAALTPAIIGKHKTAIDGAQYIAYTLLQASKTNPRKRFSDAYIGELADSIKKHGVLQPILSRPLKDARVGGPQFEIIAGECRWRASVKADQVFIPTLVREMTDLEALEIQVIENLHRADLHPIEEADGFQGLIRKHDQLTGYTVDELAARIGKSRRHIYNRLELCKLVPSVRQKCLDDKLSPTVALLVARMPIELQEKAADECIQGWGGEAFSFRQAAEHLQKRYMLTLSKAVFNIKDASLLAKAGACNACPKRTGANPDLFEDVKSADVCTDPNCFEAKTKAHGEQQVARAKAAGVQVLEGDAVKKVMPYGEYNLEQTGHVKLDAPAEHLTGTKQRLSTLLGDEFAGQVLVKGEHDDVPLRVAKRSEVEAALKAKGLLKPATSAKTPAGKKKVLTAEDIKKQRNSRVRDLLLDRLLPAVAKQLASDGMYGLPDESEKWMRLLAECVLRTGEADPSQIGELVTGQRQLGHWDTAWLKEATVEQMAQAIIAAALFESVSDEPMGSDASRATTAKENNLLAKEVGFDLSALRSDVTAEVDGAIRDEIDEPCRPRAQPRRARNPQPRQSPRPPQP